MLKLLHLTHLMYGSVLPRLFTSIEESNSVCFGELKLSECSTSLASVYIGAQLKQRPKKLEALCVCFKCAEIRLK